jgi:hypothetical protein
MTPLNLGGHCPPEIVTPDFWPATATAYRELLERFCPGEYEVIGRSAGGREILALQLELSPGAPVLALVGGMHGHEAQGPASCFNLLSILRTGCDLKGRPWPGMDRVNWAVVFCLNPDARARMPNSFVGLSLKDVLNYDAGLMADGERRTASGDVDPDETLILGGLFSDAGVDIIRHPDLADTASPEREAVLAFMAEARPAICLELHAHCAPPQFYCPLTPAPPEVQARQIELTEAIIQAGRRAGYEFADSTGEVTGLSTALYHAVSGAVPLLFESPQGVLDAGPRWDHARIIDSNLLVMAELARLVVPAG